MRSRWMVVLSACAVITSAAGAQQPGSITQLDTVLVIGEHPGPGLWKISRDGHVMWVLAAHGPLPKGLRWRSAGIEARIAESQEVLYGGGVGIGPDIGIWRGLTLIPAALRASRIPDGRTLEDVLPADRYATWSALRAQYLGKDKDVERLRPALALERLRSAAYRKSGLVGGPDVDEVVGDLRRKHKVGRIQVRTTTRTLHIEKPRDMLKDMARLGLPDLQCFIAGIERVEEDVERARRRANAWARGDIATLRQLHRDPGLEAALVEGCAEPLLTALTQGQDKDAERARKMLADARWHAEWAGVQAEQEWLAAAQAALGKNESTFAVLPLADVLRQDGPLEKLRALGYQVEEPR